MDLAALDQQLRNKQQAPIYVIVGPEAYLLRTAVARIVATVQQLVSDVTPQRFDAGTQRMGEVLAAAQGLGLFSARQLVVVARAEAWAADELQGIADYAANPNPTTTLVLTAEKLDWRTKAAKALRSSAVVIECKPLYANQVPSWVRMECQRRGKAISQEAAQFLIDAVGTELGALDQAIEKLLLYAGTIPLIELRTVEEVILTTSQKNIFAFTGAVAERALMKAIRLLEQSLAYGEAPLLLIAMLARHWRLLWRCGQWLQAGGKGGEAALAQHLKVHPFFVREYLQQARQFTAAQLARGFQHLILADRALKRSRIPATALLSRCIAGLMG